MTDGRRRGRGWGEQKMLRHAVCCAMPWKQECISCVSSVCALKCQKGGGLRYFSTHRSVFINLNVSVGYEQISRHVSARVRQFEISVYFRYGLVGEERGEILDRSDTAAD